MAAKVQGNFCSTYGHTWRGTEAIAAGVREARTDATVYQVVEIMPPDVLAIARAQDRHVATAAAKLAAR